MIVFKDNLLHLVNIRINNLDFFVALDDSSIQY